MSKKWIQAFLVIPLSGAIAFLSGAETPANLEGFKRPLVSLTFDDGWESAYTEVLPLLTWYDYKGTFFLYSDAINWKHYITTDQVREIHHKGHEIGAHSIDHADLATLLPSLVEDQLSKPKKVLEEMIQAPVIDFAAPYGSVSPLVLKLIPKYYQSNRSVDEKTYNTKANFDRYDIKIKAIRVTTTPEQVEEWLDFAQKNKLWLVFVYHEVDLGQRAYSTTPENFEKHLKAIKARNLPVVTIREGLQEVMQQLIDDVDR